MPPIAVSVRSGAPEESSADTRVIGLFEGEPPAGDALRSLVDSGEAKSAPRKLAVAHEAGANGASRRVILVGLGKRDELDAERARVAAAVATARARELGARSLSWALPDPGVAAALVEGTVLALYEFDRFKSAKDPDAPDGRIESLELVPFPLRSTAAMPCPPPTHSVATPRSRSRRFISCSSVTRIRPPLAPIG